MNTENKNHKTEQNIINYLQKRFNYSNKKELIGDDAALMNINSTQIISIDTLVENVHFKLDVDPYLIGKKLVAVSLSDIAAMAGEPKYLLISLAISKKQNFDWIKRLYDGIKFMADRFKVKLIGGDTVRSKNVVLSSVVIGRSVKKSLFRSTVKSGDLIYSTGHFGFSYESNHHYNFIPRVNEVNWLRKNIKMNSLTDASDGLYQSIKLLSLDNKLGAKVYLENIAIRDNKPFSKKNITNALYDGEDFELIFTTSKIIESKILAKFENKFNIPLKLIGKITKEKEINHFYLNKKYHIKGRSFAHF